MNRRKLSPERDLRALGDMTPDYGSQFPGPSDAMARQMSPSGYRGNEPLHDAMVRKFAAENAANVGGLLRSRSADEGTNYVAQSHPMQDIPFWGEPIHYSTGDQNINPLATDQYAIVTIPRMRVGFIRRIVPTLLSVGADVLLRITLLSDGSPLPGLVDVVPSALADMGACQNTYIRLMQGRSCTLSVRNDGGVIHRYRISMYGWHYPVSKVIETAGGVIPNEGV